MGRASSRKRERHLADRVERVALESQGHLALDFVPRPDATEPVTAPAEPGPAHVTHAMAGAFD